MSFAPQTQTELRESRASTQRKLEASVYPRPGAARRRFQEAPFISENFDHTEPPDLAAQESLQENQPFLWERFAQSGDHVKALQIAEVDLAAAFENLSFETVTQTTDDTIKLATTYSLLGDPLAGVGIFAELLQRAAELSPNLAPAVLIEEFKWALQLAHQDIANAVLEELRDCAQVSLLGCAPEAQEPIADYIRYCFLGARELALSHDNAEAALLSQRGICAVTALAEGLFSRQHAVQLYSLSTTLFDNGQACEASECLSQACRILEGRGESHDLTYAMVKARYARVLGSLGDSPRARRLAGEVIRACRVNGFQPSAAEEGGVLISTGETYATGLVDIHVDMWCLCADIARAQKSFSQAHRYYLRARRIQDAAGSPASDCIPVSLGLFENAREGELLEEEGIAIEDSRALCEQAYGPFDERTIGVRRAHLELLSRQKKFGELQREAQKFAGELKEARYDNTEHYFVVLRYQASAIAKTSRLEFSEEMLLDTLAKARACLTDKDRGLIPEILEDLGLLTELREDYGESLRYRRVAASLQRRMHGPHSVPYANSLLRLSGAYLDMKEAVLAAAEASSALSYFDSIGDKDGECEALKLLGLSKLQQEDRDNGIFYLEQAFENLFERGLLHTSHGRSIMGHLGDALYARAQIIPTTDDKMRALEMLKGAIELCETLELSEDLWALQHAELAAQLAEELGFDDLHQRLSVVATRLSLELTSSSSEDDNGGGQGVLR